MLPRKVRNDTLKASKSLGIRQNVCLRVLDEVTGEVIQEHVGHNSATNSMLIGIAHHLVGDFWPDETHGMRPGYPLLSNYVPRYISIGTMGLVNQKQDRFGLPAGIGNTIPDIQNDPEYRRLVDAMNAAKDRLDAAKAALANECPYYVENGKCYTGSVCQSCTDRLAAKRAELEAAQAAYDAAYDAVMEYNEVTRFKEYMAGRPGYGADGYDVNQNNGRKYMGLGYAFTSYDVTKQYLANDIVTNKGYVYKCTEDTPDPAGSFDLAHWEKLPDSQQPSKGACINIELISPSFPREHISFRDIVPEYEAELPKTIDVVFSAMISTGALKQFRPEGQDFIFITECGLWSKRAWEDSGENGLLAAYRVGPPNEKNWDMTVKANRDILKKNVLKVGKNQVVQVIWKIQLGSIDEFTDVATLRHQYFGYY